MATRPMYTAPSMFDYLKKRKGMGSNVVAQAGALQPGQVRYAGQGPGAQGNLFNMGGPISRDKALSSHKNPLWNVQAKTQLTQPYPDRLLKIQAAENLGYDPDFEPDVSGYAPPHRARMAAEQRRINEGLSPTGSTAAQAATELAGEPTTITNFSRSLDRDFVAAALGSLTSPPEEGSALQAILGDVRVGAQPRPGDFDMQFEMYGDKKKKRGLFG